MLRGAIVGFGEVARNGHWPAYASGAQATIAAVVDRSADRRELAARLCPGAITCATLEAVPAATVDFVDVCTPPALHLQPMLEAIDRGWHVLCEKPFLLDRDALDIVRGRAADAGVAVVPVHNWKYAPIVRHTTRLLRSGAIGALRRVRVEVTRHRAAPTAEHGRPNWRRDPAIAGGGILMDHGWHAVYLVLHWFEQTAGAVSATCHRPHDGGVEDEARLSVTFPAGEAFIDLTWNGSARRNSMRLEGEGGEIVVDDDTLHVRGAVRRTTRFPTALSSGSHHPDWFEAMLPDVVACFADPSKAHALLDEAAACLSIIQQAYRSDLSLASSRG
jgi:predicted dehydrogenase